MSNSSHECLVRIWEFILHAKNVEMQLAVVQYDIKDTINKNMSGKESKGPIEIKSSPKNLV